jgi:hypothetical protein
MSQAFVKEEDAQWLHDLPPTLPALIDYLTRENNGVRVYQIRSSIRKDSTEMHHMSNGLIYYVNASRQWAIEW